MPRSILSITLCLIIAGPLMSGCRTVGRGDPHNLELSDFYNMYLPLVRQVPHPDSLVERDRESMNQVRLRWSVNSHQRHGRREYAPGSYSSFATLWSRELALTTLDRGITADLSPDLKERMEADQEERYRSGVIFDVHLFVPAVAPYDPSHTSLHGGGASVDLEINDGAIYRASTIEVDYVDRYEMGRQTLPVYHRLNRVYFDRYVDGVDILEDAEQLRLIVRVARGISTELWFTWEIEEE